MRLPIHAQPNVGAYARRMSVLGLVLAVFWSFLPLTTFAQQPVAKLFPDIVGVKVKASSADTFDFDVTVSSPYDKPERYADAFRVMASDGTVFGERVLLHDHADEQPFTRDLYRVKIPVAIKEVVVEGRDQKSGYGGKKMTVKLPGR